MTMTEPSPISVEHAGAISTLTVQRPAALNALNRATLEALLQTVTGLRSKSDLGCLIVTGAGDKAFVAGADIAQMSGMSAAEARAFAELGQAAFAALEALPVPVIAAVNGFALGGGCELALACDFIYASTHAKFGQPEVKLGVIPGFGGTQRLTRRVGLGQARELIYTGRMIGPEEALRIGLINAIHPRAELLAKVQETASAIVAVGPGAVRAAKQVMNDAYHLPLTAAVAAEAEAFGQCFGAEQREGMEAFLGKRAPRFPGR
jgi:enoyl-CoA hydratase